MRKAAALVIGAAGILLWPGCRSAPSERVRDKAGYRWRQTDRSVALLDSGRIVWQLNYPKQGQPYFHPLAVADGTVLTAHRPADHPWHKGLWFSWKYINGLNYWDPEQPPGQTKVTDVETHLAKDYSARIELTLSYHRPGSPAVLTERRNLIISKPDNAGCYYIDWLSFFTAADTDVVLDRTPISGEKNGKSYGGYAGLSLRMADHASRWQFLGSEGPLPAETRGDKARWVDFGGKLGNGRFAGVAVFDHPDNPRHPVSWWLSSSMPYLSPAVLFRAPYTLRQGRTLALRYRVLVHTGPSDKKLLEENWKTFAASATQPAPGPARRAR